MYEAEISKCLYKKEQLYLFQRFTGSLKQSEFDMVSCLYH